MRSRARGRSRSAEKGLSKLEQERFGDPSYKNPLLLSVWYVRSFVFAFAPFACQALLYSARVAKM